MALKRTRDLEETGHKIALLTNWMAFNVLENCIFELQDSEENLKEKKYPDKSNLANVRERFLPRIISDSK